MDTWRWMCLFALLLLPLLALAGCGQESMEAQALIHQLQAAGARVVQTNAQADWPLSDDEQSVLVDGDLVEIYAYPSAQQADADAAGISSNGQTVIVGPTTLTMTPSNFSPHFYKKDALIV